MTDRDPVQKPVRNNVFEQYADPDDAYNWVRATCKIWNEVAVVHPKYHKGEVLDASERQGLIAVMSLVDYAMGPMHLDSKSALWLVAGLYPKYEYYIQEKDGTATRIIQG